MNAADALRALRARFLVTSVNTVEAFRRLARQLGAAPDAPEVIEALRRELHRVHGTAGSYGFTDASGLAAKVEGRVQRWAGDPADERDQRATIVEHFASALALAFAYGDELTGAARNARVLAIIGVNPTDSAALRSDAALRGWRPVAIEADGLLDAALAALGAKAVVTAAAGSARVARAAAALRAACVILVRPEQGEHAELRGLEDGGEVVILDDTTGAGTVLDTIDRLALRTTFNGATVLVVDDDDSILAMVRYILESDAIRVVTLDDPSRLLELTSASTPSLLLMDIRMGAYNGVDLLRALRAAPGTRDLPVILFSSEVNAATRDAAYKAGADEIIAKPLVAAELRARIGERLDRHRLTRLASGLHAATALPLPPRTAKEAPATLAALTGHGHAASVAVLRAEGVDRFAEGVEWLRETRRIADAAGAAFAGYSDGLALVLVAAASAEALGERLAAIAAARPEEAPAWRAGVVSLAAVGDPDFGVLRRAADDAIDAAVAGVAAPVVQIWSRETANLAPDVIVVEDDHALAEMIQFALRSTGLSHRAFDNGRAALDAILAMHTLGRRPLLLLDIDLPGIDGYTLHERLRIERPGVFQVVFMTVHAAEAEQIRALRAGALDYIVKPLNLRILMAKVPLWVNRATRT